MINNCSICGCEKATIEQLYNDYYCEYAIDIYNEGRVITEANIGGYGITNEILKQFANNGVVYICKSCKHILSNIARTETYQHELLKKIALSQGMTIKIHSCYTDINHKDIEKDILGEKTELKIINTQNIRVKCEFENEYLELKLSQFFASKLKNEIKRGINAGRPLQQVHC